MKPIARGMIPTTKDRARSFCLEPEAVCKISRPDKSPISKMETTIPIAIAILDAAIIAIVLTVTVVTIACSSLRLIAIYL